MGESVYTNKASRRWAGLVFERHVTFLICLPFTFFGSFSRRAERQNAYVAERRRQSICSSMHLCSAIALRFTHHTLAVPFFAFAMSPWCFRPLALRPKGSRRFTCPWTHGFLTRNNAKKK